MEGAHMLDQRSDARGCQCFTKGWHRSLPQGDHPGDVFVDVRRLPLRVAEVGQRPRGVGLGSISSAFGAVAASTGEAPQRCSRARARLGRRRFGLRGCLLRNASRVHIVARRLRMIGSGPRGRWRGLVPAADDRRCHHRGEEHRPHARKGPQTPTLGCLRPCAVPKGIAIWITAERNGEQRHAHRHDASAGAGNVKKFRGPSAAQPNPLSTRTDTHSDRTYATRKRRRDSLAPSWGIFSKPSTPPREEERLTRRRTERQRRETFSFLGKRGAGPPRRTGGFSQNPPINQTEEERITRRRTERLGRETFRFLGKRRRDSLAPSWGIFSKPSTPPREEERLTRRRTERQRRETFSFLGKRGAGPPRRTGGFSQNPPINQTEEERITRRRTERLGRETFSFLGSAGAIHSRQAGGFSQSRQRPLGRRSV